MNLCSMNHDEICYDGYFTTECPLCAALKEIEDKDDEIIDLEDKLNKLEEGLSDE